MKGLWVLAAAAISWCAPSQAAEFELAKLDGPGIEAADEVVAGALAERFVAASPDRIQRPSGAGLWLRITMRGAGASAEPLVLAVREARFSRVTLFPPRGGTRVAQSISSEEPSARFTRDGMYFVLGEPVRAGDVYYLHVTKAGGGSNQAMTLALDDLAAVNAANLRHARLITMIIGALLALGATALMIALWLGERAFLYYGGSTMLQAAYLAFYFGEGFALFPFSPDDAMGLNAVAIPAVLSCGFNILFFRELLDLSKYSQRTSAILKWFAIFFFALGAVLLPSGGAMQRSLVMLGNVGILLGGLVMLPALVVALARGSRVARFLFGAWATMQVFVLWRVISILLGNPNTPELYYGHPLSMVAAATLMAAALADRMRHQRAGLMPGRAAHGAAFSGAEYEAIVEKLRAACRHGGTAGLPTSVLKVQLDRASSIAAEHGAPVIDACMAILLSRIRHTLRTDDAVGRVGEGEALVVLPGANSGSATAIAERIRASASAHPLHSEGMSLAVTVSVGLAWTLANSAQAEALIAQAEAAAATADHAGGDQVVALPA